MSKEDLRVFYLCTAIDEGTKKERNVHFDSPAATNKVFSVAKALQSQGVDIHILSLGRGKQTGSGKKHHSLSRNIKGIPVHYAAFWHLPILTHIVGAFSLSNLFRQFTKEYKGRIIVIAYNRLWHYLPTLVLAIQTHADGYLDLEDGDTHPENWFGRMRIWISKSLFAKLCYSGTLLAGSALAAQVSTSRTFVCYGCTDLQDVDAKKWTKRPIEILFGGSLLKETGVQLLLDSLSLFAAQYPHLMHELSFTLTGKGDMAEALDLFSQGTGAGWVKFLGSVDHSTYIEKLSGAQIGLCLKLSASEMGKTTFPSKIVEYASYGLAIVSTRVSDVPLLLDDQNAILLKEETPEYLVSVFKKIAEGSYNIQTLAQKGQSKIESMCNFQVVGKSLKQFFSQEN